MELGVVGVEREHDTCTLCDRVDACVDRVAICLAQDFCLTVGLETDNLVVAAIRLLAVGEILHQPSVSSTGEHLDICSDGIVGTVGRAVAEEIILLDGTRSHHHGCDRCYQKIYLFHVHTILVE